MIAKLKSAVGMASATLRRGYEKCRGAYYGAGAALMAATAASPVFCSGGGVNIDATFQSIMEILYSIAMYMGIGIVAYAIFSWGLGHEGRQCRRSGPGHPLPCGWHRAGRSWHHRWAHRQQPAGHNLIARGPRCVPRGVLWVTAHPSSI